MLSAAAPIGQPRNHGQPRNGAVEITPEVLLKAYACGIFPMAESADDPALYWIEPEQRGIIPLDRFHCPGAPGAHRALGPFHCSRRSRFRGGDRRLRRAGPGRARTWINGRIRKLYRKLYERGHCHSVEVYDGDVLVGGLYGVSLGARVFRREHVPPRTRRLEGRARASRRAAARRRLHTARHAIRHRSSEDLRRRRNPRRQYHKLVERALDGDADFAALPLDRPIAGADILEYV